MRLRFADFVFDPDTREILRDGKPVHVSPKAFSLLAALIERRPKALSKDDLHRLVWPEDYSISLAGKVQNVGALEREFEQAIQHFLCVGDFKSRAESAARINQGDEVLWVGSDGLVEQF